MPASLYGEWSKVSQIEKQKNYVFLFEKNLYPPVNAI